MMGRIFRNLGWLLGSRVINAGFSLIYLAVATRTLGLEDFGRFALMVAMAQAVTGLASFNTWQAVVRWVGDRPASTTGFAIALDLLSMGAGSLIAVIACTTAPFWLPLPADLTSTALVLCIASLMAIRSTPTGLLRVRDRYDLASAAEAVLPATRAAGALIAAFAAPDLAGFIAAWAAAELACAAAYWLLASRVGRISLRSLSLVRLPAEEPGVWRFVLATNFSRSLAIGSRQMLLLVVGAFGGAAIAGGYRVAAQLGHALVQLGEAVSRAVYPELVRAHDAAHRLAGRMSTLALAAGVAAVCAAALAGPLAIAAIAGGEFAFAHSALILLTMAGALELLGASWDALLVASHRAELALAIRAVPVLFAFAALPRALAYWGLSGAAATVLLASLCSAAGFACAAMRLSRAGSSPADTTR